MSGGCSRLSARLRSAPSFEGLMGPVRVRAHTPPLFSLLPCVSFLIPIYLSFFSVLCIFRGIVFLCCIHHHCLQCSLNNSSSPSATQFFSYSAFYASHLHFYHISLSPHSDTFFPPLSFVCIVFLHFIFSPHLLLLSPSFGISFVIFSVCCLLITVARLILGLHSGSSLFLCTTSLPALRVIWKVERCNHVCFPHSHHPSPETVIGQYCPTVNKAPFLSSAAVTHFLTDLSSCLWPTLYLGRRG